MNDPRPENPYNRLYTVEYLGNMAGGRKTLYNNQPVDVLKKLAAASIKDGEVGLVSLPGQCGVAALVMYSSQGHSCDMTLPSL